MTTFEMQQKERNVESFNSVAALYSTLKANSKSLRTKQVVYRADEVQAEPMDFLIDVELKVKRRVGQRFYELFLRAVYNEDLSTLSETLREVLGREFLYHGLTPDGAYRRLYPDQNDQVRSYMKGVTNGTFRADDEPAGHC